MASGRLFQTNIRKCKNIKMSLLDSPDADRGAALTGSESADIFSTQKRVWRRGQMVHNFICLLLPLFFKQLLFVLPNCLSCFWTWQYPVGIDGPWESLRIWHSSFENFKQHAWNLQVVEVFPTTFFEWSYHCCNSLCLLLVSSWPKLARNMTLPHCNVHKKREHN